MTIFAASVFLATLTATAAALPAPDTLTNAVISAAKACIIDFEIESKIDRSNPNSPQVQFLTPVTLHYPDGGPTRTPNPHGFWTAPSYSSIPMGNNVGFVQIRKKTDSLDDSNSANMALGFWGQYHGNDHSFGWFSDDTSHCTTNELTNPLATSQSSIHVQCQWQCIQ